MFCFDVLGAPILLEVTVQYIVLWIATHMEKLMRVFGVKVVLVSQCFSWTSQCALTNYTLIVFNHQTSKQQNGFQWIQNKLTELWISSQWCFDCNIWWTRKMWCHVWSWRENHQSSSTCTLHQEKQMWKPLSNGCWMEIWRWPNFC